MSSTNNLKHLLCHLQSFIPQLKDGFIRQGSLVFVASLIGCACNYMYQISVGRTLGPEGYGVFGSLFAIFYLISIFTGTIQASSAVFVSRHFTCKEENAITGFLRYLLKISFVFGLTGLIIFIFITPFIADYLRISSFPLILIVGSAILFAFLLPATTGAVQGIQDFQSFAVITILQSLLKLLFGLGLIILGFGVAGALGAVTIAMFLTFLFSLFPLRRYLLRKKIEGTYSARQIFSYSLPALVIITCLAIPSNLDVIMAKHFFDGTIAGHYTAASVLGKIILFLPSALISVMFPKVSELKTQGKKTFSLVRRVLIITAAITFSVSIICIIYPSIISIIFGPQYQEAREIVGLYTLMMAFFSLTSVIAQYHLASQNLRYTYLIVPFTIFEILFISLYHPTIQAMAGILMIMNALLFFTGYIYLWKGSSSSA